MPCSCWYDPGEEPKRLIKNLCQQIVDEINRLEKIGDPMGVSLKDAQKLLEHLYTGTCDEAPRDVSFTINPPKGTTFRQCSMCNNPFCYDGNSDNCLFCEIIKRTSEDNQ